MADRPLCRLLPGGPGGLAVALAVGLLACLGGCRRETPEACIRGLEHISEEDRTRAANRLMRFDADEVVPLLVARSASELSRVRFEVVKLLGRFRDPRGVPVLVRALEDRSASVAAAAAWALGQLQAPEALPALLGYARDASPKVRQYVIAALGPCHSYEAAPQLSDSAHGEVLRALRSPTPDIRIAGLQSIRQFGYRGAAQQVLEMARDPSAEVRFVALQALGEMASGRPEQDRSAGREQVYERIEPVDPQVRQQIVGVLVESLAADEYQSIRTKAVRALGQIADPAALPHLLELRDGGTEEDQREAARAIARIRPPAAAAP
ncbi:MAG: HEAT repeat domain-containing protein [Candidatus Latescibacterota bacterium]